MNAILVALLVLCAALARSQQSEFSVLFKSNSWTVVPGSVGGAVATATFVDSIQTTGWSELHLTTAESSSASDDLHSAFGAGYLEGVITRDLINKSYELIEHCDGWPTRPSLEWMSQIVKWLQVNVDQCQNVDSAECEYWHQVGLITAQLDGLAAGYLGTNDLKSPAYEQARMNLFVKNMLFEWGDIDSALNISEISMDPKKAMMKDHCSVLIKLTSDYENLYAGHVTWGHMCHMLRIFKHYTLNFNDKNAAGINSFSSFPGVLASGDDYYTTSRGLFVAETTNNVFNNSLYTLMSPHSVPFWVRVIVANRVASSGKQWTDTFAMYNSGTYNNQWQVVDYKLFTPGTKPPANTLWIIEQIPGYTESADITNLLLNNFYFPSYNTPYFPFIYNISGYYIAYKKHGDAYSYTKAPRPLIFARDQSKIKTLDDFKNMLRYNDWKNDPLSLGDACNAISARCDLNEKDASAFGGFDCKVTSNSLMKTFSTHALSGPSNVNQPSFEWDPKWKHVWHDGEPNVFNFSFVLMNPLSKM